MSAIFGEILKLSASRTAPMCSSGSSGDEHYARYEDLERIHGPLRTRSSGSSATPDWPRGAFARPGCR